MRSAVAAVVAVILMLSVIAEAACSRPLDEDAGVALLERTLKCDGIYEKRISLDCISYRTEETTNGYFEFVLREIHNANCGGDPETSPAIDRNRVNRRSGKIEGWEATEDKWQPYGSPQTR